MTATPLREAPNLTMKLATTAKFRTTSSVSSAPASLASPQTLGLSPDWKLEAAFKNLLLHDLDAMMQYFDTDTYYKNAPISLPLPGDLKDMASISARLILLLVGADACTPNIINSVWGEDDDARLALGGPRGDLSHPTSPTHTIQSSHQHRPLNCWFNIYVVATRVCRSPGGIWRRTNHILPASHSCQHH